jgi:hypothetical protein
VHGQRCLKKKKGLLKSKLTFSDVTFIRDHWRPYQISSQFVANFKHWRMKSEEWVFDNNLE